MSFIKYILGVVVFAGIFSLFVGNTSVSFSQENPLNTSSDSMNFGDNSSTMDVMSENASDSTMDVMSENATNTTQSDNPLDMLMNLFKSFSGDNR